MPIDLEWIPKVVGKDSLEIYFDIDNWINCLSPDWLKDGPIRTVYRLHPLPGFWLPYSFYFPGYWTFVLLVDDFKTRLTYNISEGGTYEITLKVSMK